MGTSPDPRFDAIFELLGRHGVRYLVIGGMAAITHGSPFPTEDVDITPDRSTENLAKLSAALAELGARVRTASEPAGLPFDHSARSLGDADVWNLVTRYGDLDISFVPNGTKGYPDLVRDSTVEELVGVQVRVASLADVIRSKAAANRPKDQRVLPTLRELLASRNPRNRD